MANVDKDRDQPEIREPFKLHWLDSAYQQTLLPTTPWHEVRLYCVDRNRC